MTDAERRAGINRIIALQELILRGYERLLAATPANDPMHTALAAADRAQRKALVATIRTGQEDS